MVRTLPPSATQPPPEWAADYELNECIAWRRETLSRAGYPYLDALQIAFAQTVDLHAACDLIGAGCSPELAVKILILGRYEPGARPSPRSSAGRRS